MHGKNWHYITCEHANKTTPSGLSYSSYTQTALYAPLLPEAAWLHGVCACRRGWEPIYWTKQVLRRENKQASKKKIPLPTAYLPYIPSVWGDTTTTQSCHWLSMYCARVCVCVGGCLSHGPRLSSPMLWGTQSYTHKHRNGSQAAFFVESLGMSSMTSLGMLASRGFINSRLDSSHSFPLCRVSIFSFIKN